MGKLDCRNWKDYQIRLPCLGPCLSIGRKRLVFQLFSRISTCDPDSISDCCRDVLGSFCNIEAHMGYYVWSDISTYSALYVSAVSEREPAEAYTTSFTGAFSPHN